MVRGKYASRAEKTAVVKEALSEVESLRRANVKLIAENKALGSQLNEQKQTSALRVRELEARLRAGVSTELEAARLEIAHLRDEIGDLRKTDKKVRADLGRFWGKIIPFVAASEGVENSQAIEIVTKMLSGVVEELVLDSTGIGQSVGGDVEAVRRIQQARGIRR